MIRVAKSGAKVQRRVENKFWSGNCGLRSDQRVANTAAAAVLAGANEFLLLL